MDSPKHTLLKYLHEELASLQILEDSGAGSQPDKSIVQNAIAEANHGNLEPAMEYLYRLAQQTKNIVLSINIQNTDHTGVPVTADLTAKVEEIIQALNALDPEFIKYRDDRSISGFLKTILKKRRRT